MKSPHGLLNTFLNKKNKKIECVIPSTDCKFYLTIQNRRIRMTCSYFIKLKLSLNDDDTI